MKQPLLAAILLLCAMVQGVYAHPHAFVTCTLTFVMDEKGLAGFRQRWVLDEMTTVAVLDAINHDGDATLSSEEKRDVRDLTVNSLRDFGYFTAVRINGRSFPVQTITDFSAELEDNQLIYDFLVPCPLAAMAGKPQQVKVAVYDDSFYTYVAYSGENSPGVDPSKDPLFADPNAPARREDYQRFAAAVGIEKFDGRVRVAGDAGKFNIDTAVEDASDMAYYFNQIVPQSFVLRFEPR